jgi:hypothetical protein
MAPKIPLLVLLAAPAAAFCAAKVFFFPELFTGIHISCVFVVTTVVNFVIWFFWQSVVFPKFLSPLRHFPQPEVSAIKLQLLKNLLPMI